MAKITIFGLAGTGTSTVGKLVAEKLGYKFISTGNIFRSKAEELGLSLYEFEELCNKNPDYDRALDREVEQIGKAENNFVMESRLAWYFVPDSVKIKIICDETERVARVAGRDGITFTEAQQKTRFRESSGVERYKEYYGIEDFGADDHFDLIIDSTKIPADQVAAQIEEFVS